MLNHDTAAHSFMHPILGNLLYQNTLLNQQVFELKQQIDLLAERLDGLEPQVDYAARRLKQNESIMDAYENRYHEWECSENYYSLDGDPNCNC